MCTPKHRITAHSSPLDMHPHTWRLFHSLLILPSNPQGQTRRLLPHASLKTPHAQTPQPLNHLKLMMPRRDDHRPSTTRMKTITTTTTTMVAQARRLQQRLHIRGGEHRLASRAPTLASQGYLARPANWDSMSRKAGKNWMAKQAKHLIYLNQ